MSQKKKSQPNATMRQVQQRREAQAKKDRRNRTIIIAVVVVVIALIAGLVVWAVKSQGSDDKASGGSFTVSQQVEKDRGFVISSEGVGKKKSGVPTVEIYFDYSCPGCALFEHEQGTNVVKDAQAGKYNLIFHPVVTHGDPYGFPAMELATRVYQSDPDQFVKVHQALMEKAYQFAISQQQPYTKDPVGAVREVGQKQGVAKKTLDALSEDATQATLQKWTEDWTQSGISKQFATPMFARDGKQIGTGPNTTYDDLLKAMRGQ